MTKSLQERETFFKHESRGSTIKDDVRDHFTDTITHLIREWSNERGLHEADPSKQALKLGEEVGELFEGLAKGEEALIKDAIGDIYVVLTIMAQQLGFTIEECIELAYDEIKDRSGKMVDGVFIKNEDLKEDKSVRLKDCNCVQFEEY